LSRVQSGDKLYEVLFNYIDVHENPSDQEIESLIKTYGSTNNLSIHKNYLANILLECMVNYSHGKTIENQLTHNLRELEYLFTKKHTEIAEKKLNVAKQKALMYEEFLIYLQLMMWEKRFFSNTWNSSQYNLWYRERISIHNKLNSIDKVMFFNDMLFNLAVERSEVQKHTLNNIFRNLKKLQETSDQTFQLKKHYLSALNFYFILINNTPKALVVSARLILLFDEHPHFIDHEPVYYINRINNHLVNCLLTFDIEEFDKNIGRLKKIVTSKKVSPQIRNNAAENYRNHFVYRYVLMGEFKKCETQLSGLLKESRIATEGGSFKQKAQFQAYIIIIQYAVGNYKKALRILQDLFLEIPMQSIPEDIVTVLKVLRLIIYYESKRYSQLNLLLKQTNYEKDNPTLNPFELLIVNHFRLLNESQDSSSILKSFQKRLKPIYRDSQKKKYFAIFDVMLWVTGQLENKSYEQKVKEVFVSKAKRK